MNQVIRGIDFEISPGNPGAVGLYFHGAQGGATQDITVRSSGGFAGFAGGGGAGASHVNVRVEGGQFGLHFDETEPCPVVAGVTLLNQTKSAIYHRGQQTLVVAGAHIELAPGASGPAVVSASSANPITLVDATIVCGGGGGGGSTAEPFGLAASLYLQNVFLAPDCNVTALLPEAFISADSHASSSSSPSPWLRVAELAAGVNIPRWHGTTMAMDLIYRNGVRTPRASVRDVAAVTDPRSLPDPSVLVAKHTWNEAEFAALETAVDAVAVCGARGDGVTDDSAALQACVDKHAGVFLPKGRFRLSKTLELRNGTTLLGLSQTLSVLMYVPAALLFFCFFCGALLVHAGAHIFA